MAAGAAAAMLSVDDAGEAAGEGWGDDEEDDDDAVQEGDAIGEGESNRGSFTGEDIKWTFSLPI